MMKAAVIVGYSDGPVCFNGVSIIREEMTVLGSHNSCNAYPGVIEMDCRRPYCPRTRSGGPLPP
jgi:hypothetical protein